MPKKGQVLINESTGDQYEYLAVSADTKGSYVSMKATIHSTGQLVPNHIHVLQDETFEVLNGSLTVIQEGKKIVVQAGSKIVLKNGEKHNHYNAESTPVEYIHTVSPALDFEYLIENLIGLSKDGKGVNGDFGLMQNLVTLKYLDSKAYLADVPLGIQKLLMHTIAPIARLFGYRAIYKKYSGFEK